MSNNEEANGGFVNKDSKIYDNLVYRLNKKTENRKTHYFVDFQKDPHSKKQVSLQINKEDYLILNKIIYDENRVCSDRNIINICLMMESSQMLIYYVFVTHDITGNPIVRYTMFASDNKEVMMILDFDIATGLSLAHIMNLPVMAKQDWFDSKQEDDPNDYAIR